MFELRPVGDGLHAIIKVNAAEFPEEHPPEWEDIEDHYPDQGDGSDGASQRSDPESNASADVQMRELDILVAYTSGALSNVADMDALIALAIAENNLANRNSNVALRVRLVDSFEVNYTESGNFFTDVTRFRTDGDNYMDEVHTRRDQHGADMAVLIMDNSQYCGLASAILATEQTAFAGVHYTCATGNFTFAHELGHLQGARHNTQADPSTTPFAYGHGYYRLAQRDRTVMSYNCSGGCVRKAYWSNPNVSVLGAPMGTADENDNARVLNLTAVEVTNFRSVTGSGATGFAWANQPSTDNYTPSALYSHNSAKAPVRISRANTGVYSVRFVQMGGKGSYGGNVQVTPWGSSSDQCKVSSWSSGGIDFVATVRCFSAAGAPKDSYFSVFVRWP